ncbi:hypothetical protein J5N97_017818 [Dioscorea zingiberensis]|uniref:CCHC-type domain-containing protein n=1 Tax=Dioscorea zingiberensis TaxID=325984 RepID=A0A9D5CLT6_9LILI|nr:hypothetical protein J5N97_017818 [Dioscorea zingiberensis]
MREVLYGKIYGRLPPLELIRESLSRQWAELGECTVADMPNGFYMIRCSSEQMLEEVLTEGPWSVNGMSIHLIKWRPNFQPAFEELSTATIWIHLHNLPSEYWDMEPLEIVASNFGTMKKVDQTTLIANRGKFARVCIEIDLSQPLKRGVWVRSSRGDKFVTVAYEKLPVFCFRCGIIGHHLQACTTVLNNCHQENRDTQSRDSEMKENQNMAAKPSAPDESQPMAPEMAQRDLSAKEKTEDEQKYGTWMDANQRRRGRRHGYGGRGEGRPIRDPLESTTGLEQHVAPDRSSEPADDEHGVHAG